MNPEQIFLKISSGNVINRFTLPIIYTRGRHRHQNVLVKKQMVVGTDQTPEHIFLCVCNLSNTLHISVSFLLPY